MLKSIRLQNFFGFQDCIINLEKGANVLVGINGSGKSNFFKAIKFLLLLADGQGLNPAVYSHLGGLENVIFSDQTEYWKKIMGLSFSFSEKNEKFGNYSKDYEYSISLASHGTGAAIIKSEKFSETENKGLISELNRFDENLNVRAYKHPTNKEFSDDRDLKIDIGISLLDSNMDTRAIYSQLFTGGFKNYLRLFRVYGGFNTSSDSALRRSQPPRLDRNLSIDGSNLATFLNDLKISDKSTYNRIIAALHNVNEKYIAIEFKQLSGFIEMWLDEDGLNRAISPNNISDGTLKFLCLMAILYNPNRGSVICIDEPEIGLHPDMINTLHEAIEFASQTSQVIISTHSAHLLDYFELEQIRIFEKDEKNATIVEQYSKDDFDGWYKKFNPGQMWRAGDIGGKRW